MANREKNVSWPALLRPTNNQPQKRIKNQVEIDDFPDLASALALTRHLRETMRRDEYGLPEDHDLQAYFVALQEALRLARKYGMTPMSRAKQALRVR